MSTLRALTMPKWGIEMVEGIVSDWQIDEGDAFAKGDVLVGIETDKIVNEVAAEFDAVCLRRLADEGDTLAVGELLAVFGAAQTAAEEIDAFIQNFVPAGGPREEVAEELPAIETPITPASASVNLPEGVRISPQALIAAQDLGVDVASVVGCGRDGRIQAQDIQYAALPARAFSGQPVSNAVDLATDSMLATDIARRVAKREGIALEALEGSGHEGRIRVRDLPLSPVSDRSQPPEQTPQPVSIATATAELAVPFSNMRKQIARRLTASYQNIPHYNVQMDVVVDALMMAREAFNASSARKSSINDWLIRAVALTLAEHPDININVGNETVTSFSDANIAIAVAIDGGLITPVVKQAQALSIKVLGERIADLAQRAKDGQLANDDMSEGSFTVSNLGMFGVTQFTAIINPPQGAILAVGAARPVAVERNGSVAFAQQLTLTLGCDHRVIDGAMAGRFLADLRDRIEQPDSLLG